MTKTDRIYMALKDKKWFRRLGMDQQGEIVVKMTKVGAKISLEKLFLGIAE